MEKKLEVEWTEKAILSLQGVYEFYSDKSEKTAEKMINLIIETAEAISYPEQYQQDELKPEYRRMIVRHYKILYRVEKKIVYIANVFDVRQDPLKLR